MLKGKNVLLGVCGSIAAYKSALLVRLLVRSGANVKIIMTSSAKDFITPLTLATLSKNPVYETFYDADDGTWSNHVELALWADLFVIAPASANTLAKMANGICDNLLMATYLSAKCSVSFAPAMDLDMYQHPTTKKNIDALINFGNILIPPGNGELASGLSGEGRMAEPEAILHFLQREITHSSKDLKGKKVLITAGPTYEPIDPVRFIGNHSSGKMGFMLADECVNRGAKVVLVSGPTYLESPDSRISLKRVVSAEEMYKEVMNQFDGCDIAIMSAAVADYTPVNVSSEKIKKNTDSLVLELEKTKDILKSIGERKKKTQLLIGFALETESELEYAKNKLDKKNADMIVLNSLRDSGAGFGKDTNKVTILLRDGSVQEFPLKSKKEVAHDIVNKIVTIL